MRLIDNQINIIKTNAMNNVSESDTWENETVVNLIDTIKALQQENEQLKADCDRMLGEVQELTLEYNYLKQRLQIGEHGDDKIDELEQALELCKYENEQLRAQLESLRCSSCGELPELIATDDGDYCEKCAEGIEYEEMIDLHTYHNPADVEALGKAREAIKAAWSDGSANAAMDKASEALAAIDKAIGGKEDV